MKLKLLRAIFTVGLLAIVGLIAACLIEISDAFLKLFYGFVYTKIVLIGAALVLLVALEYRDINKETPNANT